jgi:hypothetical protein
MLDGAHVINLAAASNLDEQSVDVGALRTLDKKVLLSGRFDAVVKHIDPHAAKL